MRLNREIKDGTVSGTTNVILDGLVKDGYIASAHDGLHGELTFTYVPMLTEEVERMNHTAAKFEQSGEPEKAVTAQAVALAKKVRSWSEVHPTTSAPLAVDANHIGRLQPRLLWRLRTILTGAAGSDPRPADLKTVASQDALTEEVEEAFRNRQPGDTVENERKN